MTTMYGNCNSQNYIQTELIRKESLTVNCPVCNAAKNAKCRNVATGLVIKSIHTLRNRKAYAKTHETRNKSRADKKILGSS